MEDTRQLKIKEVPFGFNRESIVWEKPEDLGIIEWVETRRHLSTRSEESGLLRLSRTPYVRPWLEAVVDPNCEEVIICASAQVSKTEFGLSVCGFYTDVLKAPVLMTLADEQTSRYISRDRVRKMYESSPELVHLIDGAKVVNNEEIELANGGYVAIVWASSVAALGSREFRLTISDEVDKPGYYVKTAEATPLSLVRERTESFYSFMHVIYSTPTHDEGNIISELEACDVIYDWHVPCPHCGVYQPLRFSPEYTHGFEKGVYRMQDGSRGKIGRVVWKGGREATIPQINEARYMCGSCEKLWTTAMKNRAVGKGISVAREEPVNGARKRGFHVNRLYSLLGKSGYLDRTVTAFVQSINMKDKRHLQGFVNSTLAEPFTPDYKPRKVDELISLRDDRPRGNVPNGRVVSRLLAGIDTQDDGFYYEIRAFGYGPERTSWCIREGKAPTFGALAQVLWTDAYYDTDGRKYMVAYAFIDAMGHRTSEVYDFCRVNRGKISPTMGRRALDTIFAFSNIQFYPGTKKQIPGGIKLIRFDSNYFKGRLSSHLEIQPGDPGAWNYHSEVPKGWLEMMTVEVLGESGYWENPKDRPNHSWDCATLLLLAHEVLGVEYLKRPEEMPREVQKKPTVQTVAKSNWMK